MKPVVGIFAHPDDEVFAGGTFATFARERDVYLVCITNGEAGLNSGAETEDLGTVRKDELRASVEALGIKEVFFLGYGDGTLNNNVFGELAEKLQKIVEKLDPEILLTFEPRGVSGHIDHMFTSMLTSYVFEKLPGVSELWYYCFDEAENSSFRESFKDFFVYIPPGYKKSEISKTIDASPVWDQKMKAMQQHTTQMHDIEKLTEIFSKQKKEEYFIILNKDTE